MCYTACAKNIYIFFLIGCSVTVLIVFTAEIPRSKKKKKKKKIDYLNKLWYIIDTIYEVSSVVSKLPLTGFRLWRGGGSVVEGETLMRLN